MGKQSKPPKIGFPNPNFPEFREAAGSTKANVAKFMRTRLDGRF
jgi:hypothetical protein